MDISVYEQLPVDIGDIQTSHCTNGCEGTLGTYGHLTVQIPSKGHWGHKDILLHEQLLGSVGLPRQQEQ